MPSHSSGSSSPPLPPQVINSHDLESNRSVMETLDDGSFELNMEHQNGRGTFFFVLVMFTILGVLSFADVDLTFAHTSSSSSGGSYSALPNLVNTLSFTASNEYGVFSAPYPWLKDNAGSQLVEPYKTTTLLATGDFGSDYDIVWTINEEKYYGNPITYSTNDTGVFNITLQSFNGKTLTGQLETLLISKYVKRELRTLTVADRERFLDAAAKLWQYSDEEGQALYGSQFTSVSMFVQEHAQASGDIQCDQFHEGSGFLTHHLALTNSFDNSLRAVDPSVTLPYWDFTVEGQIIQDAGANPSYFLEISPFLSDTWFGSVDEDGHIADSRWAGITTPRVTNATAAFTVNPNSYGYMRSYWNNNNDERVKRILFSVCGVEPTNKHVPTCSDHYDILNTEDLGTFQTLSPGDGHGPMHVFFGGVGGDCADAYTSFVERWKDVLEADITNAELTAAGIQPNGFMYPKSKGRLNMLQRDVYGEYFHVWRSLWRSHMCARDDTANLLVCPESCSSDTPLSDCGCKVESLIDGTTDWENVYYCVLSAPNRETFDALMSEEMVEDLVRTVATTSVVEGEMMESASPADILFWVIHPAIDRLLSAKRLPDVGYIGDTPFQKWNSVSGENEDWLSYSYYSQKRGQNKAFPTAYTCTGHAADDRVLPDRLNYLPGFVSLADTDGDDVITNWEYFIAIDPNNLYGVDFVYDNFEWDHCTGAIDPSADNMMPPKIGVDDAIKG